MMHIYSTPQQNTGVLRRTVKLAALSVLGCFAGQASAQTIKGTVNSESGLLPGATIEGMSFQQGSSSDLNGSFTLNAPDTGMAEIAISYIGYTRQILKVQLKSGVNDLGVIQMLPDTKGHIGEILITGTMAPSQAKAYSIKKNANAIMDVLASDAIGKLPDRNAAEAVQRMQGVAVARYHGEADQATVRGTPFAWTSTLFNGNRLPSSNVLGNRSSVLDVVPSEMIQFVQLSKAITPDMDGDAIGGAVNFITRTAPAARQLSASAAAGYNTFSQNGTYNASVLYGDRFFKNKLGVMLSTAIWNRQWGSDEFATSYNTGASDAKQKNAINSVLLKRYMGKRQTMGVNLGAEYKFNASHKIYVRGMMNKFNDIRPVEESYVDYANSAFQYNFRYSHYQTSMNGAELGGEHQLTAKIKMDWALSDYASRYFLETPPTNDHKGLPIATFKQKITSGFSNLSSDGKRYWSFDSPNGVGGTPMNFEDGIKDANEVMDPNKLTLQQLVIAQLDNKEEDKTGRLNFSIDASSKVKFKVGGKYRHKDRESFYGSNIVYLPGALLGVPNAPSLLSLSQLATAGDRAGSAFFGDMGNGDYGSFQVHPPTKDQLFDMYGADFRKKNGFVDVTSAANATALYTGTENVASAYAMTEIEATKQLKIIAGVRFEHTAMELKGSKATKEGTPATTVITPSVVSNDYNAFLPMVHLKYAVNEKANIRAAYTRTFVRPNFGDMTPGSSTDNTRNPMTITQGNSTLKPTFSNNFDLMGEYYFDNVGLISGGAFYKKISDVVFTDISMQNIDGDNYLVTQAKNLKSASLLGFEAGINKRFDFLPGFWNGFGMEVNYTFIDSKVEVPRGVGAAQVIDKTTLPNQSKHLFNAIVFYEKKGLMIRLAGNYRGASVETINQQLGPDFYIWMASNFTLDASATVSITRKIKAFVELNNLSNSPVQMYMGDKRRITDSEWYGRKGQIGIRWNLIP